MHINLSQQIPATYARNHFKEVMEDVIKEGIRIIVRKSKPVVVVLSMDEYGKIKNQKKPVKVKKMTLEELRKNSVFEKYVGCMKDTYPKMTSVEIAKKWTDYVD